MLNINDADQLSGQINRNTRELVRAWNSFHGYVEHWRTLSEHAYQGALKLEASEERATTLHGTICSKSFTVHASPLVVDQRLYIEVVVTAEFIELGLRAEAARFLVSSTGDFHQPDTTKSIDALSETPNYSVLTNLLTQVLGTPAPPACGKV